MSEWGPYRKFGIVLDTFLFSTPYHSVHHYFITISYHSMIVPSLCSLLSTYISLVQGTVTFFQDYWFHLLYLHIPAKSYRNFVLKWLSNHALNLFVFLKYLLTNFQQDMNFNSVHDAEISIHTCLSYFFLGQIFPQSLSFLNMKNSFLPHIITSIIFYLLLGMVFPSSLLTIIT